MKQLNKKDKAETEHACKEIIFTDSDDDDSDDSDDDVDEDDEDDDDDG